MYGLQEICQLEGYSPQVADAISSDVVSARALIHKGKLAVTPKSILCYDAFKFRRVCTRACKKEKKKFPFSVSLNILLSFNININKDING